MKIIAMKISHYNTNLRPLSLSELTLIISYMELTHIGTVASISFKRELIYIHTYNIAYLKGIDVLIGMC